MKIGIDLTPIIHGRGVSRYTSNLAVALTKQHQVYGLGYSLRQKSMLEKFVSKHQFAGSALSQKPQTVMSMLWKMGQNSVRSQLPEIEVFHSWDWLQPPDKDLPLVSTIHDLAMLKHTETAHPQILKAHQKSWQILKERQAHIIAVSQATKKDIINLLGIPKFLVHVVHEALPEEFKETANSLTEEKYELIKQQLQLNQPFILFVGTREPRKNLERLIQAWQPLSKDYQLIVAGEPGWDGSEKLAQNNLRFLGHVDDEALTVLYGEAEVFAYPSLYEGFGLPILEAFFHGTPVLTSATSSMPEVAGNAAVLVDPESVESIRQGLEKLLNESPDEQKKRLQRMIIRLQMFNWDRVAAETAEVYRTAIKDKNG